MVASHYLPLAALQACLPLNAYGPAAVSADSLHVSLTARSGGTHKQLRRCVLESTFRLWLDLKASPHA